MRQELEAKTVSERLPRSVEPFFERDGPQTLYALRAGQPTTLEDMLGAMESEHDATWRSPEHRDTLASKRLTMARKDLLVSTGERYSLFVDAFGTVHPIEHSPEMEAFRGKDAIVNFGREGSTPLLRQAPERPGLEELVYRFDKPELEPGDQLALAKMNEHTFATLMDRVATRNDIATLSPKSYAAAHVLVQHTSRQVADAAVGLRQEGRAEAELAYARAIDARDAYVRSPPQRGEPTPRLTDWKVPERPKLMIEPQREQVPIGRQSKTDPAQLRDLDALAKELNKTQPALGVVHVVMNMSEQDLASLRERVAHPNEVHEPMPRSFASANLGLMEATRLNKQIEAKRVEIDPQEGKRRLELAEARFNKFFDKWIAPEHERHVRETAAPARGRTPGLPTNPRIRQDGPTRGSPQHQERPDVHKKAILPPAARRADALVQGISGQGQTHTQPELPVVQGPSVVVGDMQSPEAVRQEVQAELARPVGKVSAPSLEQPHRSLEELADALATKRPDRDVMVAVLELPDAQFDTLKASILASGEEPKTLQGANLEVCAAGREQQRIERDMEAAGGVVALRASQENIRFCEERRKRMLEEGAPLRWEKLSELQARMSSEKRTEVKVVGANERVSGKVMKTRIRLEEGTFSMVHSPRSGGASKVTLVREDLSAHQGERVRLCSDERGRLDVSSLGKGKEQGRER